MTTTPEYASVPQKRLAWLDPLKAMALVAIVLNHFVEEFARGPWFTNPSRHWPDFAARLGDIYPTEHPFPISLIQFLGWLGDSGPGVFILLSGFGLTWSALHRPGDRVEPLSFYERRLWRILPLYILCHFVIFGLALFVPGNALTLASPKTLLSLLGLRFHDSLFFYINPSWWFVWLILQLYLVFPLLYRWLSQSGMGRFLTGTIVITVFARSSGLIGFHYNDNLYYWMTGLFFGTRLAEFSAGMVLARWLFEKPDRLEKTPVALFVAIAAMVYSIGLACSFTLPGTVISNFLVTVGMSGLFYGAWAGWLRRTRRAADLLAWIGVQSFGIFLIHQTPLKWTQSLAGNSQSIHLALAVIAILASIPLGAGLNRFSESIALRIRSATNPPLRRGLPWGRIILIALLLIIDPRQWPTTHQQIYYLLLGLVLLKALILTAVTDPGDRPTTHLILWTLLFTAGLKLFILYHFSIKLVLPAGMLLAGIAVAIYRFKPSRAFAWLGAGSVALLAALCLEVGFSIWHPVEANRWGEFPALEPHPTRIYALKPNRATRLRYNNYDYTLVTNSLGLPGGDIRIEKSAQVTHRILVVGDAFTMPEGLPYDQAYPQLLERLLSENTAARTVEIVNAGVTGYGPVEQLPQIRELVPALKPDIVIYQFFVNEFAEVQLDAKARLRSIGFIPRYRSTIRNQIESTQTVANLRLLQSSITEVLTKTPAQWRYLKSLLPFYEIDNNPYFEDENLQRLRVYLDQMAGVCRSANAAFIIYFVPASVAVSIPAHISYLPVDHDPLDVSRYDLSQPFWHLKKIADSLAIPVVDLSPYLKQHPKQPVYFRDSWHWNREGHQIAAAAIKEDLLRRNLF